MLRPSLYLPLLLTLLSVSVGAQSPCSTTAVSENMICLIPQIYGPSGLDARNPDPALQGQFGISFLTNSLGSLQSSISRQTALLPLASPASGVIFQWDPAAKAYQDATDSYGPILGERADTLGRYRVFVGFDYQYFRFSTIDGLNMRTLPVVLPQDDYIVNGTVDCSINSSDPNLNFGDSHSDGCGYIRDVITTQNSFDLKIHQFTTFITFGLTNRIDISVAIPIENVRLGMTSIATISQNDSPNDNVLPIHAFPSRSNCAAPCLSMPYSSSSTASGIGDINLRVKAAAWKGEKAALALGADVRTPTGDGLNFLGAGTAGVKPFIIWSYRARLSPHAFVGYEINGSSIVAGDVLTGSKERLPGDLTYAAGADIWITKRLTAAADVIGQQLFQDLETKRTTYKEPGQCQDNTSDGVNCDPTLPVLTPKVDSNLTQATGTFNVTNVSLGAKGKLTSTLLLTGNVVLKLNNAGLRSSAIPLVGLSYTF